MASSWIAKKVRLAIYNRDEYVCCYCNKKCLPASKKGMTRAEQAEYMRQNYADIITLDHIVPRGMLSAHEIDDPKVLCVVCNACNSSKRHSELKVWTYVKGLNYNNIIREIDRRVNIDIWSLKI